MGTQRIFQCLTAALLVMVMVIIVRASRVSLTGQVGVGGGCAGIPACPLSECALWGTGCGVPITCCDNGNPVTITRSCCAGLTCAAGTCVYETGTGGADAQTSVPGTSGTTGTNATNGTTGTNATNGTTGTTGATGNTGTTGTTGTTGGQSSASSSSGPICDPSTQLACCVNGQCSIVGDDCDFPYPTCPGGGAATPLNQCMLQCGGSCAAGASCTRVDDCFASGGTCTGACGPNACCCKQGNSSASSGQSGGSSAGTTGTTGATGTTGGGACGNGTREGSEECDDGNRNGGDGCTSDCRRELCGNGTIDWNVGEECDGSPAGCIEKFGEYKDATCWNDCKCNFTEMCGNESIAKMAEDCEPGLENRGEKSCLPGYTCTGHFDAPRECRCVSDSCKPQLTKCPTCDMSTEWVLEVSGLVDRWANIPEGTWCHEGCGELNGVFPMEIADVQCKIRTKLVGEGPLACYTAEMDWRYPDHAPSEWVYFPNGNFLRNSLADVLKPMGMGQCNAEMQFDFWEPDGSQNCTKGPDFRVVMKPVAPDCTSSASSAVSAFSRPPLVSSPSSLSSFSISSVPSFASSNPRASSLASTSSVSSGGECMTNAQCVQGQQCIERTCIPPQCQDKNQCKPGLQCISGLCISMLCGNGAKDAGEECDDGNAVSTDGCTAACLLARCGDGYLQGRESCDDGVYNARVADVCRPDCRLPVCGDGIIDSGESCDDGNRDTTDACANNCTLGLEEACVHNDDCASLLCFEASCIERGICGNGIREEGEWCDDGPVGSTVCSVLCLLNDEQVCTLNEECSSSVCRKNRCVRVGVCGDGITDDLFGEECDQGDANSNIIPNRCRKNCRRAYLGDGVLDRGEQCDDGNTLGGDGCSSVGVLEQIAANPIVLELPQQQSEQFPPMHTGAPFVGGVLDQRLMEASVMTSRSLNDSGPAAVVFMVSGAAAGFAWMRRKQK